MLEWMRRRRVDRALREHMSADVLEKLVSDDRLGLEKPREVDVTVLVVRLTGFEHVAEPGASSAPRNARWWTSWVAPRRRHRHCARRPRQASCC